MGKKYNIVILSAWFRSTIASNFLGEQQNLRATLDSTRDMDVQNWRKDSGRSLDDGNIYLWVFIITPCFLARSSVSCVRTASSIIRTHRACQGFASVRECSGLYQRCMYT